MASTLVRSIMSLGIAGVFTLLAASAVRCSNSGTETSDFCTVEKDCSAKVCQKAASCTDGVCAYTPQDNGSACDKGACYKSACLTNQCVIATTGGEAIQYKAGDKNPADPCQACDPSKSASSWTKGDCAVKTCTGTGACDFNAKGDGVCVSGTCHLACTGGACPPNEYCDAAGYCSAPQVVGSACKGDSECSTGFCEAEIADPSLRRCATTRCNDCRGVDASGVCIAMKDGITTATCAGSCSSYQTSGTNLCCAGSCQCSPDNTCH